MANPSLQIGNSNWAIKESNLLGYSTAGTKFLPQPITMTRASAGTRVNSSGLVETVELLGSEEITNGEFTTDSDWDKTNATISNGKATITVVNGSYSLIGQSVTYQSGKIYKLTAQVQGTSGKACTFFDNGSNTGGLGISNGIINFNGSLQDVNITFTSNSNSNKLLVIRNGSGDFSFNIDNVSVKEVTRNNLARVDYDGTASSLLVEPQRTNQFVQSNNFNTSWTQTSVDVATDVITSPISGELADSVTATTATAQHRVFQTPASTGIGTFTMYIKQGELSRICIHFLGTNKAVGFDCSDNTTFAATGIASYPTRYTISDFGNGWSKVEMYDVGSTTRVDIYIANPTVGGNNAVWTGDVTSKIYFAAAQFELGSYATSYIPTDGSSVTRVQDQYEKTGISNLINSEEGVLFGEMAALANDGTNRFMCLSDGSNDNRVLIGYRAISNQLFSRIEANNSASVDLTHVLTDSTEVIKFAIKYDSSFNYKMFVNGVLVDSGVGSDTIIGLNSFKFTNAIGTENFFGKVKQLQIFKTALTDSELVTLTTI